MPEDPSPTAAVRRFAGALREIRARLLDDLYPVADIAELLVAVCSRRTHPRNGVTASGIEYSVHGVGCRMTAPDGREVDVDLVTDPGTGGNVEAFDAWRVHSFLDDDDARTGYDVEDLASACASLAGAGVLREVVEGRWYALADDPPGPADTPAS